MPRLRAVARRVGRVLALGARRGDGAAVDTALPMRAVSTLARAAARFLTGASPRDRGAGGPGCCMAARPHTIRVSHLGFTHTPFGKSIPANKFCERASHQEAVARIRFCVAESLLGVLTGEVGVGKTVALRAATSQLDQAAHHVVYLANPSIGTRGLYSTIVRALGAAPRGFKAELVAQTQGLWRLKNMNAGAASCSSSTRVTCSALTNWRSSGF